MPGARPLAGLLACCLLVVTACGSTAATRADVISRGNAICLATLRSLRALPPPSGSGESALRAYLRQAVPLVQDEVSQLRKLPRPARDRAVLDRYLAAVRDAGGQYRRLATAAERNDPAGVTAALGALRATPAGALARQYGLKGCASAAVSSSP